MTEHSFDLAAASSTKPSSGSTAATTRITRILVHEFGDCILNANHTTHDTGHTVKMWAYDEHGILAAAQADAPHVGGTARAQIVTFRAGHELQRPRHRGIRRPRPIAPTPSPRRSAAPSGTWPSATTSTRSGSRASTRRSSHILDVLEPAA